MRLQVHMDLLRGLEARLGGAAGGPGSPGGAGGAPPPYAPAAVDCKSRPALATGTDYHTKVANFSKLIALAFACDRTRVATLQLDVMGTADFGAPGGDVHQDYAHHDRDPARIGYMKKYYARHGEHFATLLRELDQIREANGRTVLDNTIVLWGYECGSWMHQTSNLPIVIAGGAGAFRMGRYLYWPQDEVGVADSSGVGSRYGRLGPPVAQLLVSVARALTGDGAINQIGNVATARGVPCTGPLEGLG
jgi:hypothetical protein